MDPHFHAMKDRDSSDINNRGKNMRIENRHQAD